MPEISYIQLACKKINVDPQSLLKFHETPEGVYVITAEGKKIKFTFEELEDYDQYLKDNEVKPEKKQKINQVELQLTPETPQKATGSPRSEKKPSAGTKSPKTAKKTK